MQVIVLKVIAILPYIHKGAVTAMTKAMAVDESRYQVRVNWWVKLSPCHLSSSLLFYLYLNYSFIFSDPTEFPSVNIFDWLCLLPGFKFKLFYSISPGNVMTSLWEELAGLTENPSATIKGGENAQVSVHEGKWAIEEAGVLLEML